jgi:hypothetical protein
LQPARQMNAVNRAFDRFFTRNDAIHQGESILWLCRRGPGLTSGARIASSLSCH